jgi:outer membrane protein assembly factor BamE (lipoprotein component of BamABCDE complex)
MRRLLSAILLVLVAGCGKPLPEFENLDLNDWKNDKNACGQYRTSTIDVLRSQKEKLLALEESQIIELLGRPDRNELYKRNQKFYYYYLTASPDCKNTMQDSRRLAIRFNAMGFAKEVAIE